MKLSRRSFFKGAAAISGAVATVPVGNALPATQELVPVVDAMGFVYMRPIRPWEDKQKMIAKVGHVKAAELGNGTTHADYIDMKPKRFPRDG